MKGSAAVFLALAVTACSRTDLAAQPPALTAQGERTNYDLSFTEPAEFVSPCNGETVSGVVTTLIERQLVVDASGGQHFHAVFHITGSYTGQSTGLTYTEATTAHSHNNLPSSGAFTFNRVFNGWVSVSDGSTILNKEHITYMVNAGGEVKVERHTGELRCLRG